MFAFDLRAQHNTLLDVGQTVAYDSTAHHGLRFFVSVKEFVSSVALSEQTLSCFINGSTTFTIHLN